MWCGDGHIHKECPETEKRGNSIPNCCNCKLKEGERPHPSNYRGCSHAKEEIQRKSQQSSNREPTRRKLSTGYVTPGKSFAAALRNNPQQQTPVVTIEALPPTQHCTQNAGQSAQAPNGNSSSINDMFKVASGVEQIITGINEAVSEEQKIVAITKIVMKLMNSNGC
jgi:hypothetical protein